VINKLMSCMLLLMVPEQETATFVHIASFFGFFHSSIKFFPFLSVFLVLPGSSVLIQNFLFDFKKKS